MIWQTTKPKYLSSVLILGGSIFRGVVTADLICVDNQTIVATSLPLSEIGTSGCYQLLIDENLYTIDSSYYKAIYYYDSSPRYTDDIIVENSDMNRITNQQMIGIVNDTQTMAGLVEQ